MGEDGSRLGHLVRGLVFVAVGAGLGAVSGFLSVQASTFTVCSIGKDTCPAWVNLDGEELTVPQALAAEVPKSAAWGAIVGLVLSRLTRTTRFPTLVWSVTGVAVLTVVLASYDEILHLGEPEPYVDLAVPLIFGIGELLMIPVGVIAFIVDVRRNRAEHGTWLPPRASRREVP